jgi:murein L,D-transpeptidase YafK
MRIRMFTGSAAVFCCGIWFMQAAANPLHADRVVVLKKERTLQLLSHRKVIKSYTVALGGEPVGPKTQRGDHKTPEGVYTLDS